MTKQQPKKGSKFKFGALIEESGLPRLRRLWKKFSFSRSGVGIFYLLIALWFVMLLSAGFQMGIITFFLLLIFNSLGIAAGLYFFVYGILHLLEIGEKEKRHMYSASLPIFIFIFAFLFIRPNRLGIIDAIAYGRPEQNIVFDPLYIGIIFIFIMIVMIPIILSMFLNSGFFASVTLHEFIMKRSKRLSRSKGFRISVLLFLMVALTLLLLGSLFSSQDPQASMGKLLIVFFSLLFPFFIAIMGFSKSIGTFQKVRPIPERSEVAFFLGVVIFSVYAYLQILLFLLIVIGASRETTSAGLDFSIDMILNLLMTIYYFTSILGVLAIGSMRAIKIFVEDKG